MSECNVPVEFMKYLSDPLMKPYNIYDFYVNLKKRLAALAGHSLPLDLIGNLYKILFNKY